ncbi:hypothetical protein JXA80_09250 [bacterium]|nr:hypothetical protein [candidate division CSSED10-310 bacterium]
MRKYVAVLIILGFWVVVGGLGGGPVFGQTASGQTADRNPMVLIVPFGSDGDNGAPALAARAAWMIRKKLRIGDIDIPEIGERTSENLPVTWENRMLLGRYFETEMIAWLIDGRVESVCRDEAALREGPRVFGIAREPIRADIRVRIHDCRTRTDLTLDPLVLRHSVPRLRVFGIHRKPFPVTPRAMDAVLHDGILTLTRQIIDVIQPPDK